MGKMVILLGGLAILIALTLPGGQAAARRTTGEYDLSWNTLASGGALEGSNGYTQISAAGQPLAGKTSLSPYELCAGYLCGARADTRLYLPPVTR